MNTKYQGNHPIPLKWYTYNLRLKLNYGQKDKCFKQKQFSKIMRFNMGMLPKVKQRVNARCYRGAWHQRYGVFISDFRHTNGFRKFPTRII